MFKRIRLIMALVFLGLCSGSLMAQTVSGSYMISSTNEFGTHYLAFDGTSLADATTFNPATCMWDVAITDGTCTVSMDGNYLTMSGSTVAIGTPATTFTISDGKLMAGGNYLVFNDEWKAVDENAYRCHIEAASFPLGTPYYISAGSNYMYGYWDGNAKLGNKNILDNDCNWFVNSRNSLCISLNNKTWYLTADKGVIKFSDKEKDNFCLDGDNHFVDNKGNYIVFDGSGWSATNDNTYSGIGVATRPLYFTITDGIRYAGTSAGELTYSATPSNWYAESTAGNKTAFVQNGCYLTLDNVTGASVSTTVTENAKFEIIDESYLKKGPEFLGYTGWASSDSDAGAATLTGPASTQVITFETTAGGGGGTTYTEHFMTISGGAIADKTPFDANTCIWIAVSTGTNTCKLMLAVGGQTYYLKATKDALSAVTNIAEATEFTINGHQLSFTADGTKYLTYDNGWKIANKNPKNIYYGITSDYHAEQLPSAPVTASISYGSYSYTSASTADAPSVYTPVEAQTMPDLGKYFFQGTMSGTYDGYPEYYQYDITGSSFHITTYYQFGKNTVSEYPSAVQGWTLTQVTEVATGAATQYLHTNISGANCRIDYGTWGDENTDGWGSGNDLFVKGEPQEVMLSYGYSFAGVPVAGANVMLTVKAPTWKDYVIAAPEGFPDVTNLEDHKLYIRDEKDLAWLISIIDGFNNVNVNAKGGGGGNAPTYSFEGDTICLTRDLDMGEYQWCPISTHIENTDLRGDFDGCGYIIKNLRCSLWAIPGDGTYKADVITTHLAATRGFIGNYGEKFSGSPVVKNVFFENVEVGFPGGSADCGESNTHHFIVGGIIGGSDGNFIVKNCGISGRVFMGSAERPANQYIGAIAGYVGGTGTIESCYSVAEVEGCKVGGLVGQLSGGSVKNSFANPILKIYPYAKPKAGDAPTYYECGGLVACSAATLENCYVRMRNVNQWVLPEGSKFGLLIGTNTTPKGDGGGTSGSVDYCYAYDTQANSAAGGTGNYPLVAASGVTVANYGLYNRTIPYKHNGLNNTLTHVVGSTTYAQEGMSLLDALNNYAGTSTNGITTRWARTTSDINEDYPILRFDDFNNICSYRVAVNHDGPDGPTDELLDPFMYYKPTLPEGFAKAATYENGAVVALYKNEDIRETAVEYNESKIKFYIDEEASLLHDAQSPLKAYVGVTFRNAVPGLVEHDAPENCYWHMLSTPLDANSVPLGIDYNGDDTQYNAYPVAQDNLPQFGWITEGDKTNNGYFPDDTPYGSYDFYSWYEPEYQWVNFKRNGPSHWHEDTDVNGNHAHFDYTPEVNGTTNVNESYLIPGKGYLMAIDKQMFLQTHGTLNEGDVTYPITCSAAHIPGYNFIGNPYHSYLDIEAFFDKNESQIWSSSASYPRNYILMNGNEYITYVEGISDYAAGAPRYLNMHQGFIVIADKNGTVTFTNDMRTNDGEPNFREAKINYPLINLHVTDENGYGEVAVVEVGRPERGGARKAHEISRANCILYAHQGDEDYSVLFLEEGISSTGVWFEPFSDGQFTMKWDTHNGTFDYLHLIDNIAGVDIDCTTTDSYTFQSSTSDYKSRFKLVFSYTGVEENVNAEVETFAFQSGDNLIVNGEGRLEIIDMNGRLISATELYGAQNAIAMPNVAQGVYLLRQINDKNVKVQKIVVK